MKQTIILDAPFYLYVAMYVVASTISLQATYTHPFYSTFEKNEINKQSSSSDNQLFLDMYTTLHIIKNIHQDIETEQTYMESNQLMQQDFITDIIVVLVDMYEKIVGATVTYYIMINVPLQQNLHHTIAMIIAEHLVKIINIACKRFLSFIFDHTITWQQKMCYCVSISSVILLIKLGIDQIPQSVINEAPLFDKIKEAESGYLNNKFNSYK